MLERLMAKYNVFSIRQLRKVATVEEIKDMDKYLLEKVRAGK